MEQWKDIPGYNGTYQASNSGLVRSFARSTEPRMITPTTVKPGYLRLKLGHSGSYLVHRLVALAFIPNPLELKTVNHINGIKTDNRVENLEWMSHKHNVQHAHLNGLVKTRADVKGEKHPGVKLTTIQVREIRDRYSKGNIEQKELAIEYRVGSGTISDITRYKSWKHIT